MSELPRPVPRLLPVAFDGCAGWLHPAASRRGVLLCGALNHEILPLYQSWHALARMLAEAGLPALRFDYHGTGDSIGGDRDARRVEAWLASLRAAARFMREEVGVEILDVVGVRLGATLAALTAAEIGIDRMALIAPIVSGRSYVREAQARSKMLAGMWRLNQAACPLGDIANDGFIMTRDTAAAISRIDLSTLVKKPASEVLILSEKPAPATEKFGCRLAATGCTLWRDNFTGFATAMDSATLAKIPFEDWRKVVAFLENNREGAEKRVTFPKHHVLATPCYHEERTVFGTDHRLAGVLCRPVGQQTTSTLLFLNTGGNPHLGWGRMSVEHARILAARGIASLRMDIAGLGDASLLEGSPRAALYRESSMADAREALDFLQARGLSNFVAVGHCSGAWLAFNAALVDGRIRRLFLVNLQRFIWTGEEDLETLMARAYRATDSYLQEIGSGAVWRRALKGEINWPRLPGIAGAIVRRAAARISNRLWPIAARMLGVETQTARIMKLLKSLSQRGQSVVLVYSDTDPGREELARHFGPSGRRLQMPGIQIATLADADHDITSEQARNAYLDLLSAYLGCEQGPGTAEISSARPASIARAA